MLAPRVRAASHHHRPREQVVNDGESSVLPDQEVDLGVLMIDRDGETDRDGPNRLVLVAAEADGIGAGRVPTFAQVVSIPSRSCPSRPSRSSSIHSFISRKIVWFVASWTRQSSNVVSDHGG
jgi:hypothetical protein